MSSDMGSKFSLFLVGLGLGAALGLLFAPRSGRETRERLRSRAEEGKHYFEDRARELRGKAEEYVERGKELLEREKESVTAAIEAGKRAYREEKRGA